MRILITAPDFPMRDGGLSTVALELARGFHRQGHDVAVQTPQQTARDREFDSTLAFKVYRLRNVKDHYLKLYYHVFMLNALMKRGGFDCVIAQSWYPSGVAAVRAGKKYGVKTAVMVNGNEILSPRFSRPFWRGKMREVFNGANRIFSISSFTAGKLRETMRGLKGLEEKLSVCCCGVDPDEFVPGEPDAELKRRHNLGREKIILTLARLVERKGQDMMIKALPEIKRRVPDVKYVICGKGGYEGALRETAKRLGVLDDVIFAGFVPDAERIRYYNLCDVFAMPSREIMENGDMEGFGIAYLEANACGKPVIGGLSGGVSDAVEDGVTGLLVNPDDPAEIARSCIALLEDNGLSERLGRNGRERVVRKFNWDSICREIAARMAG